MSWQAGMPLSTSTQTVPSVLNNPNDKQVTALDELAARLDRAITEAAETGSRLERLIERTAGPTPKTGEKQPGSPPSSGMIGLLMGKIDQLSAIASWQRQSLAQLEGIL